MSSTFYELLGIPNDATVLEIRAAYKKLALQYHPDKNPDCDKQTFESIHLAYSVLRDKESRAKYDTMLKETMDMHNNEDSSSRQDAMDTLVSYFMDVMMKQMDSLKKGVKGSRSRHDPKFDLVLSIDVTLEELYRGDVKKLVARVKRDDIWTKKNIYINLLEYRETYVFSGQSDNNKGDIIVKTKLIMPPGYSIKDNNICLRYGIDLFTLLYGGEIELEYLNNEVITVEMKPLVFQYEIEEHGLPYIHMLTSKQTKKESNSPNIYYGTLILETYLDIDLSVLSLTHVYDFIKTYFKHDRKSLPQSSGSI